jgi:membrane associated rhomboid family serine protease
MTSFTVPIIILTAIISFIADANYPVKESLIFWPPAIHMKRQYYRFITYGLIHANFMHLAFNMFTFYFFGKALEYYYAGALGLQHYYYLILYVTALIASNIPTYLKHKDDYNYRGLGASGAVIAVQFAFILLDPWETIYLFTFIPVPAILFVAIFVWYSIYMGKRGGDNVNHSAHLWGGVYGVLFTVAVRPEVISTFLNELRHPRFHL